MEIFEIADDYNYRCKDGRGILVRVGGKTIAYQYQEGDGGYKADFDATESADPAEAEVFFTSVDYNFAHRFDGEEFWGREVKVVSPEEYGIPSAIVDVELNLGFEVEGNAESVPATARVAMEVAGPGCDYERLCDVAVKRAEGR